MMKFARVFPTVPLRIISVLYGMFLLMIPPRETADWSSHHAGLYYSMVLVYVVIASVRIRKVSQSILLTVFLASLAAAPFLITLSLVVGSLLKFDFVGTDRHTWFALLFVLSVEALLPLALGIEFNRNVRDFSAVPPERGGVRL